MVKWTIIRNPTNNQPPKPKKYYNRSDVEICQSLSDWLLKFPTKIQEQFIDLIIEFSKYFNQPKSIQAEFRFWNNGHPFLYLWPGRPDNPYIEIRIKTKRLKFIEKGKPRFSYIRYSGYDFQTIQINLNENISNLADYIQKCIHFGPTKGNAYSQSNPSK